MSNKTLYIGLFVIAAAIGAYLVISHKKQVFEDLAPETQPVIVH